MKINSIYCSKFQIFKLCYIRKIKTRIAIAKAGSTRRKFFTLFFSKLDFYLRKEIVKCHIWSMALYGAEIWKFRKGDQRYLESSEMWCWRREKISWTDRVKNEAALQGGKEYPTNNT
jgi:hypothetical protein